MTVETVPLNATLRFGEFEVDFNQWQLRRSGLRVKLQRKPFQILRYLLERHGVLVTRSELARELWPGLHVDFERSLNTAVNCLRQTLGDTARSGLYIETCPGLGYRFVGPVEVVAPKPGRSSEKVGEGECRKGRYFLDRMVPDNLARARAFFEAALRVNARAVRACAGLAEIDFLLAQWSIISTGRAASEAKRHADRAVAADPASADAHVALAHARWLAREPWSAVEAEFRAALAIQEDCIVAHVWYATFISAIGRFEEAAQHLEVARAAGDTSLLVSFQTAWSLYLSRNYRGTLEQSWSALVLEPSFAPAQFTLGLAYQHLGLLDDAITEFENACRCSGDQPAMVSGLAHALARAARREEALALMPKLHNVPFWRAIAEVGLGDSEKALASLEEAGRAGDCLLDWLAVEPRFDSLRGFPRFQKWLRLA